MTRIKDAFPANPIMTSKLVHVFLVRCFRDEEDWRFMLEEVGTRHKPVGFSRLEDLLSHLVEQLPTNEE